MDTIKIVFVAAEKIEKVIDEDEDDYGSNLTNGEKNKTLPSFSFTLGFQIPTTGF